MQYYFAVYFVQQNSPAFLKCELPNSNSFLRCNVKRKEKKRCRIKYIDT